MPKKNRYNNIDVEEVYNKLTVQPTYFVPVKTDFIHPIVSNLSLVPAKRALEQDIRTARTIMELQALAGLELEYPLVYGYESVQELFRKQKEKLT